MPYPDLTTAKTMQTLERLKILAIDQLRFSKTALSLSSRAIEGYARLCRVETQDEIANLVQNLAKAGRAGFGLRDLHRIDSRIEELMRCWSPNGFQWDNVFHQTQPTSIAKSIILKKPQSSREKGVIFIAFETHWIRLFRHANIMALARDYDLVLSPTWSPPHDLAFFIAARLWPSELFTILSNFDDISVFERISPRVHPIPLLASNWVNPDLVRPVDEPVKQVDIVMLANFAKYKRHFALFQALASMDPSVRVLLLGVPWEGRSRHTLEKEAELFGVRDRVIIREALPDNEMFRDLRSAKISVIMSLVEGSCVAVVESLFAGIPVGLLEGARIGSGVFINGQTGRLLRPSALASDLTDFLNHYREYQPRKWAMENGISCRESSALLNAHLKKAALASGQTWTVDLVPFHWRPNAKFLLPSDEHSMQDEYSRFYSAYGVSIDL